jgi:hypothetical protein
MKIELLLKIQKILDLLLSLLLEIENSKADIQNDCYLMQQNFDTEEFENIIIQFFKLRPCRKDIDELRKSLVQELTSSCVHQFMEDDIECNIEELQISYCILCGIKNTLFSC